MKVIDIDQFHEAMVVRCLTVPYWRGAQIYSRNSTVETSNRHLSSSNCTLLKIKVTVKKKNLTGKLSNRFGELHWTPEAKSGIRVVGECWLSFYLEVIFQQVELGENLARYLSFSGLRRSAVQPDWCQRSGQFFGGNAWHSDFAEVRVITRECCSPWFTVFGDWYPGRQ